MRISPDELVYWQWGPVNINATLVFTWGVMALLIVLSWLVTRKLSAGPELSRGQNLLEVLVTGILDQIQEASQQDPRRFLPFVGTLFIFIATSNLLGVVPGFQTPTGSLSTTSDRSRTSAGTPIMRACASLICVLRSTYRWLGV